MPESRDNRELSGARRVVLAAFTIYASFLAMSWVLDTDHHWLWRVVGAVIIPVFIGSYVLAERDHRRAVRDREAAERLDR